MYPYSIGIAVQLPGRCDSWNEALWYLFRVHVHRQEVLSPQRSNYRACYFGSLKGLCKSVQVLFHGIKANIVLTLIILKQRAVNYQ